MDRETISKLRLDRRLTGRRGWISPDDLERELEALPDVSEKVAQEGGDDAQPLAEAPSADPQP
jgi:hypothetical protein